MKWLYFNKQYSTIQDVRSHFREYCIEFHPDKHLENKELWTNKFQAMYTEYEKFLIIFIPSENEKERKEKGDNAKAYDLDSEGDLANTIADLMKYAGLIIEICGSWLWLTGNTYSIKDDIKNLGFRWQGKKQSWYFAGYEFEPHRAKTMTMEHIRNKYGSKTIETEEANVIG